MIDAMRKHEADHRTASAVRAGNVRDGRAIRQQPFEFVFAPAMTKGNAMECCERGSVSRTRVKDRGLRPLKKLNKLSDHWRGT